jgi:hypothetical protein
LGNKIYLKSASKSHKDIPLFIFEDEKVSVSLNKRKGGKDDVGIALMDCWFMLILVRDIAGRCKME